MTKSEWRRDHLKNNKNTAMWMNEGKIPNRVKGGGAEMEQSRCQSHASHVAVVDLPPLSHSSYLYPSIPCFSPLCQDVSSVSQHGVRPSHDPVFPPTSSFFPPLSSPESPPHPSPIWKYWHTTTTGMKVEPIVLSNQIMSTQYLLQKEMCSSGFHFEILTVRWFRCKMLSKLLWNLGAMSELIQTHKQHGMGSILKLHLWMSWRGLFLGQQWSLKAADFFFFFKSVWHR